MSRVVTSILVIAAIFPFSASVSLAQKKAPALKRADALSSKARQLFDDGKYTEALGPAREALSLREKHLGKDHPDVAAAANNLAGILEAQGNYVAAKALYERSLKIFERASGPADPKVATALGNLAGTLKALGDIAVARSMYERALSIDKKAFGEKNSEVATDLNNLASLLEHSGDLAAAKPLYERALKIDSDVSGPESPAVAIDLNNLAGLLEAQGDYEAAKTHLDRALKITEKAKGPDHPDVAVRLFNLGGLMRTLGDNAGAKALYERALAIDEKALGPDNPEIATDLNNLANLLATQGDAAGAQAMYERALSVLEKGLGHSHLRVASALSNLGNLLRDGGDFAAAQKLFERSLEITRRSVSADHPDMYVRLFNVGLNHWSLGETQKARDAAAEGFKIVEKHMQALSDVTSERERIELVRSIRGYFESFVSLFSRDDDAPAAYGAQLVWKGAVMSSLLAQRHAVLQSSDPALRAPFTEMSAIRRNLAALTLGVAPTGTEVERLGTIADLTARKETLERELAQKSRRFRDEGTFFAAGLPQVCASLAPAETLLDYLRFDRFAPADAKTGAKEKIEPSYLAFVVRGGDCKAPVRVELGPSGEIDRAVGKYRSLVKNRKSTKSIDAAAAEVRRLVWDPVSAHAGERKQIWLVPDGSLSGVPFAALPKAQDYLIERFTFGYLGTATEILRLQASGSRASQRSAASQSTIRLQESGSAPARPEARSLQPDGALVVGGIDFGAPPAGASGGSPANARDRCDILEEYKRLDGAETEVRDVGKLLSGWLDPRSVTTLRGTEATEAAMRRLLPGKKVVHLATHGFFAELKCAAAKHNPMVRSGVVFAGVNERRGRGDDDGVLTAEEVAGLDLRGTDLVVLSACETGLGEIVAGEGVLGLRRAFALSGVRSLLMSVWKVPDEETRRLMADFYESLSKNPETPAALREAQLKLLKDNREKLADPLPHTWAGFIASGK